MLLRVGRNDGLLYDTLMFVCFQLYDHPDSCRCGCVEGKWIGAQPRVPKSRDVVEIEEKMERTEICILTSWSVTRSLGKCILASWTFKTFESLRLSDFETWIIMEVKLVSSWFDTSLRRLVIPLTSRLDQPLLYVLRPAARPLVIVRI